MSNAFDNIAEVYDEEFSHAFVGSLLRKRVWCHLDRCFSPNQHILELNCGTGEDALYLLQRGIRVHATDAAENMLQITKQKVAARASMSNAKIDQANFSCEQLDINHLGQWQSDTTFDGVLSNFGGLNCIDDLAPVAKHLHRLCKPNAHVVLCIMGPYVPWEWLWFSCRGEFKKAFRRFTPGDAQWHGMTIHYPSLRQVKSQFAHHFQHLNTFGLGALLPPPFAEKWANKRASFTQTLNRWEQHFESSLLFTWFADHYVLEFNRKP